MNHPALRVLPFMETPIILEVPLKSLFKQLADLSAAWKAEVSGGQKARMRDLTGSN